MFLYISIYALPQEKTATTEDPAVDLVKDSVKGSISCSSVPPPVSECTESVDTYSDTAKAMDHEDSIATIKDEKPSSSKFTTSDSSPSACLSSSHPACSSRLDRKKMEIQEDNTKEGKIDKVEVKKGSVKEEKMEVDSVKLEPKMEKTEAGKTTKPSRPSSTPPSSTGMRQWALHQMALQYYFIILGLNISTNKWHVLDSCQCLSLCLKQ